MSLHRRFFRLLLLVVVCYTVFRRLPSGLIHDSAPSHANNVAPEPVLNDNQNPLGRHIYREDGLVEANLDGPHPLYELITRAEHEWSMKLSRASKTLEAAVVEYQRRYKRRPPRGFDIWWDYAQEHNVQLPDEYDTIAHDLEPFWGLRPSVLQEIQAELEREKDSYTIGNNALGGNVSVLTYALNKGSERQLLARSTKIIELFEPILDYLPSFRMTILPHDAPNRSTDYGMMQALLEAASSNTRKSLFVLPTISFLNYTSDVERDALPKPQNLGWVSACPPNSPASQQAPFNLDDPPPRSSRKTLIHDHVKSMDPCLHPHLLYQHGQLLSHHNGPRPQKIVVPQFSACSDALHHNIRLPLPYAWVEDIYPRSIDPVFEEKTNDKLLWRGSNTGILHASHTRWESSHRNRLVACASNVTGLLRVLDHTKEKHEPIGGLREYRKEDANPALLDVSFSGKPLSPSPDIVQQLQKTYHWARPQSQAEAGNYKYVLDIDGNGWSGRFKRLMTSNSLIFKNTIYPEWFADRVQPWVHYVPIQLDLSDLHDTLIFFRGDLLGFGAHEEMAKKIAEEGRRWSKEFWRMEDLTSYMFRLTLEFARLMSEDREAMSY